MSELVAKVQGAIASQNKSRVRAILKNAMRWDIEKQEEIETCMRLVNKSEGIFEPHDGRALQEQGWDEAYLNQLRAELDVNFSQERCRHLYRVAYTLGQERLKQEQNGKKFMLVKVGVIVSGVIVMCILLSKIVPPLIQHIQIMIESYKK